MEILPSWIRQGMDRVEGYVALAKRLAALGGNVRSTGTNNMGGDGKIYILEQISGKPGTVVLTKGVEAKINPQALVVQTAEGEIAVMEGREGDPISVAEANRVAPRLKREIGLALGRDRNRKKGLLRR